MSDEHESPSISVVLPSHNEVTLLGSTITNLATGFEARARSFEILVVENGSSDGTLRLARLLAAQVPEVRVITLPRGDYGAALRAGIAAARGGIIVCFDVDYYDLAFFDEALRRLDAGAEVVVASKRATGARDERPLRRRLLTAGFTTLLRRALDLQVSDAHGMKVLRAASVAELASTCVMHRSMFDVELVLRAERHGLEVAEIPARVRERRPPRSPVSRRALESIVGIGELRARLWLEARAQHRDHRGEL